MTARPLARASWIACVLFVTFTSLSRGGSITVATTSVTREFAADKGGPKQPLLHIRFHN